MSRGRMAMASRCRRSARATFSTFLLVGALLAGCKKVDKLPTEIARPEATGSAGKCFVDLDCPAGIWSASLSRCADKADCSELWKCPGGVRDAGACSGGTLDCAYSPGCRGVSGQVVQSCATGTCVSSLQACTPRIKIAAYSFNPGPNQCDCRGADPRLESVQRECGNR